MKRTNDFLIKKNYSIFVSLVFFLFLFLPLTGCGAEKHEAYVSASTTIRDNTPVCLVPSADGDIIYSNDRVTVDISNLSEGYIMALYTGSNHKVKLQLTGPDYMTYTYDLNGDSYEVFPLSAGNGTYQLGIYENIDGNQYAAILSEQFDAQITNEMGPFLYPNQYINYTPENQAVLKAEELCAGQETGREKYKVITEYVTHAFVYDFVRAVTTRGDGVPDVDYCFNKGMGICLDLASTSVCMLRTQGVPAKLVIGNANGQYHAWVQATVDGEEKIFDPTAILQNMAQPVEYAAERWY